MEEISRRVCRDQARFLPLERIDLETEKVVEGCPHWTDDEIRAFLDYGQRQEEEQCEIELAELKAYSGRFCADRGNKALWAALERKRDQDRLLYRFAP